MKLTFPHMGMTYIPAKIVFDRLGLDYVMPRVKNRDALEKALTVAPESICLPFKCILGNLIEGLDAGADTILFGGGHGRCRLSYFGELLQETLEGMGYRFRFIFMDFNRFDLQNLSTTFAPFIEGKSALCVTRALVEGGLAILEADRLYALAAHVRCRERRRGQTDAVMRTFESAVQQARAAARIQAELRAARHALRSIPLLPDAEPLRVMIVGEIFTASEPFVNLELERRLGDLGVQAVNTLGVFPWVRDHFLGSVLPFIKKDAPKEAAGAFVHTDDFGGLGVETVGNAALAQKEGFDGVIQIYPLTCMPEVVAQSVMPHVQTSSGVPVMTLVVDELTGEAGFETRLEAFVDMLAMRKNAVRSAG